MTIRLNKVTRDLNVGITTVVEFLQKKGHLPLRQILILKLPMSSSYAHKGV